MLIVKVVMGGKGDGRTSGKVTTDVVTDEKDWM